MPHSVTAPSLLRLRTTIGEAQSDQRLAVLDLAGEAKPERGIESGRHRVRRDDAGHDLRGAGPFRHHGDHGLHRRPTVALALPRAVDHEPDHPPVAGRVLPVHGKADDLLAGVDRELDERRLDGGVGDGDGVLGDEVLLAGMQRQVEHGPEVVDGDRAKGDGHLVFLVATTAPMWRSNSIQDQAGPEPTVRALNVTARLRPVGRRDAIIHF